MVCGYSYNNNILCNITVITVITLDKSENYRQATQANPDDLLADKDPLKAENPKTTANSPPEIKLWRSV